MDRYDTSHIDIPTALYKKKNKKLLKQSPVSPGKQILMALRLVEAGCRYVTVTSAGTDMHGNAFGVDVQFTDAGHDSAYGHRRPATESDHEDSRRCRPRADGKPTHPATDVEIDKLLSIHHDLELPSHFTLAPAGGSDAVAAGEGSLRA